MNLRYTGKLNGSNTDDSFTTAVSKSFLSPWEKSLGCRFGIIEDDFLFYIENGILCILIRASVPSDLALLSALIGSNYPCLEKF